MRLSFLLLSSVAPAAAGVVADIYHGQPSSGCGKPLPDVITRGESRNLTIDSDSGVSPRKYRIHVPQSYRVDTPVPLIFSFHGRGKDMKYQEELSQFSNRSFGFEGIAVYPEGVPTEKGTTQWQGDPDAPDSVNDVTFTLELLSHLESRYCIDTSRVYASGKSNGGGFTGVLACDSDATERIAAFAAVSGAFYLNDDQQLPACRPSVSRKKVPVMELHGLQDTTIPYLGGLNTRGNANSTNIPDWVNAWAFLDGFDPEKNRTEHLCTGSREVTIYTWDKEEALVHYLYSNMEHTWPSEFGNADAWNLTTCHETDGTKVVLEWLSTWRLQGKRSEVDDRR